MDETEKGIRFSSEIPYFPQIDDTACAPAVIQMALARFGIETDQITLAQMMKTSAEGTAEDNIVAYLRKSGLNCTVQYGKGMQLDDICSVLSDQKVIVVCFREPQNNEGHFAIVTGCTDKELIFHDPWNGANFAMKKNEFLKRWYSENRKYERWMMTIYERSS